MTFSTFMYTYPHIKSNSPNIFLKYVSSLSWPNASISCCWCQVHEIIRIIFLSLLCDVLLTTSPIYKMILRRCFSKTVLVSFYLKKIIWNGSRRQRHVYVGTKWNVEELRPQLRLNMWLHNMCLYQDVEKSTGVNVLVALYRRCNRASFSSGSPWWFRCIQTTGFNFA